MSQQQRASSGTPPVKRSRPDEEVPPLNDGNTDHTHKTESNHTQPAPTEAPPPNKQAKMAPVAPEIEGEKTINGVSGEEDEEGAD